MAIEVPASEAATDVEPAEEACARCGRVDTEWSEPVTKDEERYCCVGCLQGTGCTCEAVAGSGGP